MLEKPGILGKAGLLPGFWSAQNSRASTFEIRGDHD